MAIDSYLDKPVLLELDNLQLKICPESVLVKFDLASQTTELNLKMKNLQHTF